MVKTVPNRAILDLLSALDVVPERDMPMQISLTSDAVTVIGLALDSVTGKPMQIQDETGRPVLATHTTRILVEN